MEKAISGFKSSGIWPFNPNKFTAEDFEGANQYMLIVSEENMQSSSSPYPGPSTSYPFRHLKENVEPASFLDPGPSASQTPAIVHSNKNAKLREAVKALQNCRHRYVIKGKTKKGIKQTRHIVYVLAYQ